MDTLPETGKVTVAEFRAVTGYDWETIRTIFLSGKGPGFYAGKRLICRWEWVHRWLAGDWPFQAPVMPLGLVGESDHVVHLQKVG